MDSSKSGRCSSFVTRCLSRRRVSHTKVEVLNGSCKVGHADWCEENSYGVCPLNCLKKSEAGTPLVYENFKGKRIPIAWDNKRPSRLHRIVAYLRRKVADCFKKRPTINPSEQAQEGESAKTHPVLTHVGETRSLHKSHVTFWDDGTRVEVSPVDSGEDIVGDQDLDCESDNSHTPVNVNRDTTEGTANDNRGLCSQGVDQTPDLSIDHQPFNSIPSCTDESDATMKIVRSRGDAGNNDLRNERENEADDDAFKDQDNIVFSIEEEENSTPDRFDAVESPEDGRNLARCLTDTPVPVPLPFDAEDDEDPKPSSIWYDPEVKRPMEVKLFEDSDDKDDIFDVVNRIPRTQILTNLQTIISFSKITISKTDNVLRRWEKINLNPLSVPTMYGTRAEYIEDLTLPLDISTSLHLQESSRLLMQYDTITDALDIVEKEQSDVIKDIKRRYIRAKPAPTNAKELAAHYTHFRKTKAGRTIAGRREEMKRLTVVMDVISEEVV
ncbi:uncharacterized protein [Amphiura filiformis]|uniref:uncharacterized protein n=1 Tax=Amphiura filiformis TaxID=82378 RepID=UPI003B224A34